MRDLVVLGAGGFAQEVAWIVDDLNAREATWRFLGFIGLPADPSEHYGHAVLRTAGEQAALPGTLHFACGIGEPGARRRTAREAEARGWRPATLVHPTVITARFVQIGEGSVVAAGSILAPGCRIGRHCAVNLHVSVGHDSVIGDYSVLSPGARVSGHAVLEEGTFLGSNACVSPRHRVGAFGRVGANSVTLGDVPAGRSVLGVPARAFLPPGPRRD